MITRRLTCGSKQGQQHHRESIDQPEQVLPFGELPISMPKKRRSSQPTTT
jgi:hypothetical protein